LRSDWRPDTIRTQPVALAIIGDEALVVLHVGVELHNGFIELACRGITRVGYRSLEVHLHQLHDLQGLVDISVRP
jgi:hypothetical protein